MNPNKLSRIIFALLIFCIILSFTALISFIINFSDHPLSDKIETWGQFGDYFGGVLNPILSLVNILVFVTLTITIQEITNKNNKESLDTSKKIALMSMKHEELIHFKDVMDKNLEQWNESLEDIEMTKKVLYGYNVLEYRMLFVFPELNNSENNKNLRKYIVEALNNHKQGKIKDAAHCHIPVSNTYGMLVSDMGKWTVS